MPHMCMLQDLELPPCAKDGCCAGIVLTNDGNAILREIDVTHPAAKVSCCFGCCNISNGMPRACLTSHKSTSTLVVTCCSQ